jgi:hypothetical protein
MTGEPFNWLRGEYYILDPYYLNRIMPAEGGNYQLLPLKAREFFYACSFIYKWGST